jgi:hypothetical protein
LLRAACRPGVPFILSLADHGMSYAVGNAPFGKGIDAFLNRVARDTARDTIKHPLSADKFEQASLDPTLAQLAFVNAVRRSLGKDQGALSE